MKRLGCLVGALLAGVLVTDCTSADGGSPDRVAGGEVTPATTPAPRSFRLGEKAEGGSSAITVSSLGPVTNEHFQPDQGMEYRGADIEGCAGPDTDRFSVSPYSFRLQTADGTRIHPTVPWKVPALNPTELGPGECVRGWVTFEAPAGEVGSVVYEEPTFSGGAVITWLP